MKQQTIIRDGFISKGSAEITGSLNVTQGITGALTGTASFSTQAISASYVSGSGVVGAVSDSTRLNGQAASYYLNASNINAGTLSNSYLPSSINITSVTASFKGNLTGTATTASYVVTSLTASFIDGGFY